jgi:GMP synthase-like glutamine amidotransferase
MPHLDEPCQHRNRYRYRDRYRDRYRERRPATRDIRPATIDREAGIPVRGGHAAAFERRTPNAELRTSK